MLKLVQKRIGVTEIYILHQVKCHCYEEELCALLLKGNISNGFLNLISTFREMLKQNKASLVGSSRHQMCAPLWNPISQKFPRRWPAHLATAPGNLLCPFAILGQSSWQLKQPWKKEMVKLNENIIFISEVKKPTHIEERNLLCSHKISKRQIGSQTQLQLQNPDLKAARWLGPTTFLAQTGLSRGMHHSSKR